MDKMMELNLDFLESDCSSEDSKPGAIDDGNGERARCHERKTSVAQFRRAWSESKLLEILPVNLREGYSYHCISGGNIDSLSYLKHIIRLQPLDYCLFSTWCMAEEDVRQFGEWTEGGKIGRLDAYVGEIFPGSYAKQHKALRPIVAATGGRVCVFRNHAKIYAGTGPKFCFAVESSANINTNPRTENTTIHIGADIFEFYKEFFDGIKSYAKDFPNWKPYGSK